MSDKMSRWGVGPEFTLTTLAVVGLVCVVHRRWCPAFVITGVARPTLFVIGAVLVVAGLVLHVIAVVALSRAYAKDELVTTGAYRFCRHPIYGVWIVLIVPGIILMVGWWLLLSLPLAMYLILRIVIRKEEHYLEGRFGTAWLDYKSRTNLLFPGRRR